MSRSSLGQEVCRSAVVIFYCDLILFCECADISVVNKKICIVEDFESFMTCWTCIAHRLKLIGNCPLCELLAVLITQLGTICLQNGEDALFVKFLL